MTTHFQVRTIEVRTLFQVPYSPGLTKFLMDILDITLDLSSISSEIISTWKFSGRQMTLYRRWESFYLTKKFITRLRDAFIKSHDSDLATH